MFFDAPRRDAESHAARPAYCCRLCLAPMTEFAASAAAAFRRFFFLRYFSMLFSLDAITLATRMMRCLMMIAPSSTCCHADAATVLPLCCLMLYRRAARASASDAMIFPVRAICRRRGLLPDPRRCLLPQSELSPRHAMR